MKKLILKWLGIEEILKKNEEYEDIYEFIALDEELSNSSDLLRDIRTRESTRDSINRYKDLSMKYRLYDGKRYEEAMSKKTKS